MFCVENMKTQRYIRVMTKPNPQLGSVWSEKHETPYNRISEKRDTNHIIDFDCITENDWLMRSGMGISGIPGSIFLIRLWGMGELTCQNRKLSFQDEIWTLRDGVVILFNEPPRESVLLSFIPAHSLFPSAQGKSGLRFFLILVLYISRTRADDNSLLYTS